MQLSTVRERERERERASERATNADIVLLFFPAALRLHPITVNHTRTKEFAHTFAHSICHRRKGGSCDGSCLFVGELSEMLPRWSQAALPHSSSAPRQKEAKRPFANKNRRPLKKHHLQEGARYMAERFL